MVTDHLCSGCMACSSSSDTAPGPQELTVQPRMDGWVWNVHSKMMHMYVESSADTKVEKEAAEEVVGGLRRV